MTKQFVEDEGEVPGRATSPGSTLYLTCDLFRVASSPWVAENGDNDLIKAALLY